jgi:hypothetical protein
MMDTVSRAGSLLPALWAQVRPPVAVEGSATLCTWAHPVLTYGDDPPGPLHVDVDVRLWNKTSRPATVLDIDTATLNGQELSANMSIATFKEVTLRATGKSERLYFTLHAPAGELVAQPGDILTIRFRLNRGVTQLVGPKTQLRLLPG